MSKKLYLKTYGCQMNVYDSQKITDLLRPLGYEMTDSYESADLAVLNTCNIREKATEKVYSDLGRIRDATKHSSKKPLITVAGCVAQAEGEEITKRAPYVDFVIGPQTIHELPELIARHERGQSAIDQPGRGAVLLDFEPEQKFDGLPEVESIDSPAQFLTIQEGCDKFCRFCCVPYTRGAEYSRPAAAIIKEAKQLIAKGAREITLLGQNVNAYRGKTESGQDWGLGRLLFALAELDGLERLRYTTSHPNDMDDVLIEAHRDIPQLMPLLHLPVQSGSDGILKAMNRKHTAAEYLNTIERLRDVKPNMAFSSDFIVGFPGETDADFADTLALVENVNFAQAFSFQYSKRPGTPAAVMEDPTPLPVKAERLSILQSLLQKQQLAFNAQFLNQTVDVLFERRARTGDNVYLGRTPHWQNVLVHGNEDLIGKIIPVTITEYTLKSLKGTCNVSSRAAA